LNIIQAEKRKKKDKKETKFNLLEKIFLIDDSAIKYIAKKFNYSKITKC